MFTGDEKSDSYEDEDSESYQPSEEEEEEDEDEEEEDEENEEDDEGENDFTRLKFDVLCVCEGHEIRWQPSNLKRIWRPYAVFFWVF